MERSFGIVLSELRRTRELSQRRLAADLHISQALLSHYENGTREPGLPFVCRVCDYFDVTADYILGRTDEHSSFISTSAALCEYGKCLSKTENNALRDSAENYIDAAAVRICERISGKADEVKLARQSVEMSNAELRIIQIISKL